MYKDNLFGNRGPHSRCVRWSCGRNVLIAGMFHMIFHESYLLCIPKYFPKSFSHKIKLFLFNMPFSLLNLFSATTIIIKMSLVTLAISFPKILSLCRVLTHSHISNLELNWISHTDTYFHSNITDNIMF